MEDLKDIIAKNLVRLRQKAGLTQLKLAEMLNYSDKAVSKWERGESIPDLRVLIQLAEIYNIKVDDIISEQPEKVINPKMNLFKKRVLIVLLSVGLVWFIATGVFAMVYFSPVHETYAWLTYIIAPFVSAVLLTVFSGISIFSDSLVPIRPDSGVILKAAKNESASTIRLSIICTCSTCCNISLALRARAMASWIESGTCFLAFSKLAAYSS